MPHAHDHNRSHAHPHAHASPELAVAEADAWCAAQGVHFAGTRRAVFSLLAESRKALGAYDLLDLLATPSGKRPAPITVYRALDFLIETGLAHRIASRNAFTVCPHRHDQDEIVVFLICRNCGSVEEEVSEAVRAGLTALTRGRDFQPHANVIEVEGFCAACRAAGLPPETAGPMR